MRGAVPPAVTAMRHIFAVRRRRLALIIWGAGLLLFLLLGVWNINADKEETANRLSGDAGRMAAQLAALLSLPAWELDELTARTIVMAAMEDESIYAIKVQTARGMLEGQRRNYQWEPVPWDDEITEDSVQGMNPLKMEGRVVGSVEVYLSPRVSDEDLAQKARREVWRFALTALFATGVLALLLWQWGDLDRLRGLVRRNRGDALMGAVGATAAQEPAAAAAAESLAGTAAPEADRSAAAAADAALRAGAVLRPALGRAFARRRPEAWRVTAALFGQTFAHAPSLLGRLFEEGDAAGLCRLGQVLKRRLRPWVRSAWPRRPPPCRRRSTIRTARPRPWRVEQCLHALEDVLATLNGPAESAAAAASQPVAARPADKTDV